MNRIQLLKEHLAKLDIHSPDPVETIYKYVDVKTALKIIRNNNLLYQSPKNFNDPLDPHLSLLDLMKHGANHIDQYKDIIPKHMVEHFVQEAETTFDELKRKQVNNTGILCTSRTFRSTLMWSHYSDKHNGICLGFKNIDENGDYNLNAFVVKYADNVEPLEYSIPNKDDNNLLALLNMFCTKAKPWHYEQEVRIIKYLKSGLYPFDKASLCEIYFGVNTSLSDFNTIRNAVKRMGYKIQIAGKMRTDKAKFELHPEFIATAFNQ